jgi:hypothetical protein
MPIKNTTATSCVLVCLNHSIKVRTSGTFTLFSNFEIQGCLRFIRCANSSCYSPARSRQALQYGPYFHSLTTFHILNWNALFSCCKLKFLYEALPNGFKIRGMCVHQYNTSMPWMGLIPYPLRRTLGNRLLLIMPMLLYFLYWIFPSTGRESIRPAIHESEVLE